MNRLDCGTGKGTVDICVRGFGKFVSWIEFCSLCVTVYYEVAHFLNINGSEAATIGVYDLG